MHRLLGRTANFFRITFVFLIVSNGCIFFRAPSVSEAFYIFKTIYTFKPGGFFRGEPPTSFGYYLFAVALLFIVEHFQEFYPDFKIIQNNNVVIRYTGYVLLLTILLMVGVFNGGQFIYFQF